MRPVEESGASQRCFTPEDNRVFSTNQPIDFDDRSSFLASFLGDMLQFPLVRFGLTVGVGACAVLAYHALHR